MPEITPQVFPNFRGIYKDSRRFQQAVDGHPSNFELLFSDGSWRNTWTHIVPGRFSLSPYTGLLFFEQSTGYAEVYETDGQGRIVAPPLQTYSPLGGRAQWTHVIPGLFGSSGLTGILLYDQPSGFARFFACTGDAVFTQLSEYSDWRDTWTQIVPGFFTKSANPSLVFYSPSEGYGELWETNGDGLAGTAPVQTASDLRLDWTHIVAADFFPDERLFAPVFSDLFFYEASTGYGEMYRFDDTGMYLTASGNLIQGATNVIAGNFGYQMSNVLLHDRSAGQLKIYWFTSGEIAERETLSGLRTTFDLVVPGKFYMANSEDHWFNDGPGGPLYDFSEEQRNWRAGTGAFTDLLLYDSAAGLGETYLHEPIPPPAPALDAYISCKSSDDFAAPATGSVLPGGTLSVHISSLAPCTIEIYRQGYFAHGQTEQLMTQIGGVLPATGSLPISRTAYKDGAGWPVAASMQVADLPSGLYLARVQDTSSPPNTVDVPFVVRAPSGSQTKILLVIADVTYAAYNDWGGRNVYGYATATDQTGTVPDWVGTFPSVNALHAPYAFEVSFERPVAFALLNSSQLAEIPMIQWLMRRGIPVDVCTARDLHFQAPAWPDYRLLLFVGHHEYWTWEMRDNVEYFAEAGGGVGFFGGNTCWWQVRISRDGTKLTCCKIAGFDSLSTTNPRLTTVNWWDSIVARPETDMTGASYYSSHLSPPDGQQYIVQNSAHWALHGTGLSVGDGFGLCGDLDHPPYSVIGIECDVVQPQGGSPMRSPPNYTIASARDPRDKGETATMGSFKKGAGEVFNAATITWALGLADDRGCRSKVPQITQNVIDRLGPAFQWVPRLANDIGAGADGSVWIVGTDAQPGGYGIYQWTGSNWQQVPGAAVRIAVDPNGNPWVVNSDNRVFQLSGGGWQDISGPPASDIGAGADGSVWIVGTDAQGPDGYGIYQWTGSNWQQVPGAAVRIAVDPNGNPWVVQSPGRIWEYVQGTWRNMPGPAATDIGVGPDGTVWIVGADPAPVWGGGGGNGIFRLNGTDWRQVPGGAASISVGPGGNPWIVSGIHQIFFWG